MKKLNLQNNGALQLYIGSSGKLSDPDPAKRSGSGSATLVVSYLFQIHAELFKQALSNRERTFDSRAFDSANSRCNWYNKCAEKTEKLQFFVKCEPVADFLFFSSVSLSKAIKNGTKVRMALHTKIEN